MKLIVDMNHSPEWVEFLMHNGFNAEHWSSIGLAQALDVVIMAYAEAQNCVVLTNDLDFGSMLAATNGVKPSVIQIRSNDLRPTTIGTQIIQALHQTEEALNLGALVTVDAKKARIAFLPLKL